MTPSEDALRQMAEEPKQKFDPDATVAQPAEPDPDATIALPAAAPDADATVDGPAPLAEPDAESTFTGAPAYQPEAFDPDATVNPAARASFDAEATAQMATAKKMRSNPFAPKSLPESIHANLAALGGLNPLIAMANPILGAVPQIRRALRHPDPAGLLASLQDQLESLQMSAEFAEVSSASVDGAVYALCALLDESAAATPWGGGWIEDGLLKKMLGETNGGEGFFARLKELMSGADAPDGDRADLREFYYVCLALGFEGRYRQAEHGREALHAIRNDLYARLAERRPRPGELSPHWRSSIAEAAAAPALQMAAQVAAQISAKQAAAAAGEATLPPARPSLLSRIPRRVAWSAVVGIAGAMIAFYMLALRLLDDETRSAVATHPRAKARIAQAAAPATAAPTPMSTPMSTPAPAAAPPNAPVAAVAAPTPAAARDRLAKALAGAPVTITESAGGVALALRADRQFAVGSIAPAAGLRPLIRRIAAALNGLPGAIVVTGHADASPTRGTHFASNAELSAARARAVAQLMAPVLKAPGRLQIEGKGDAEPLAPGHSPADNARNRRFTIAVRPKP